MSSAAFISSAAPSSCNTRTGGLPTQLAVVGAANTKSAPNSAHDIALAMSTYFSIVVLFASC